MAEPLLAISTARSKSETVIKLSGECDISNVDDLYEAVYEMLASETRRIVLDVEELDFMGSCGLTAIQRAIEGLKPFGGVVVIQKPSWMLRWLLDLFGMSRQVVVAG